MASLVGDAAAPETLAEVDVLDACVSKQRDRRVGGSRPRRRLMRAPNVPTIQVCKPDRSSCPWRWRNLHAAGQCEASGSMHKSQKLLPCHAGLATLSHPNGPQRWSAPATLTATEFAKNAVAAVAVENSKCDDERVRDFACRTSDLRKRPTSAPCSISWTTLESQQDGARSRRPFSAVGSTGQLTTSCTKLPGMSASGISQGDKELRPLSACSECGNLQPSATARSESALLNSALRPENGSVRSRPHSGAQQWRMLDEKATHPSQRTMTPPSGAIRRTQSSGARITQRNPAVERKRLYDLPQDIEFRIQGLEMLLNL